MLSHKILCKNNSSLPFFASLFILFFFLNACKQPSEMEEKEDRQNEMEGLMQQDFYMTKDPKLGYVPIERKLLASEQLMQQFALGRTNDFSWQERGPSNIAGRVRAVLIDRRDPSGNTIFSGGVAGGLWKCTNFKTGPIWTKLVDTLPNLAITCIAQDPTNLNVMYAGTGEGWFNSDAVRGNGILKTTDGGNTWGFISTTRSASGGNFDFVQDIVVTSTGIVYASARSIFCSTVNGPPGGGVLRSTDGTNFTRVIGNTTTTCTDAANYRGADLELASNGDLYATTGFQSTASLNLGRIWRSPASLGSAQGTAGNWTEITPSGTWRRIEIAVAPSNSNVIYALLQAGSNNAIGGIRRSDNAGVTWDSLPLPVWCDQGNTSTDFTRTQAWYDLIARVDPTNPLVCYIGGVDILKTTDGGGTWAQVTQWAGGCSGLPQVHADQHEILFIGNSSQEMIAANDGGLYYSPNAGAAWGSRNTNYNITQFYSVDLHPTLTNYILGGTQDNGTQRFIDAGMNATSPVLGGDGAFTHIDQNGNGSIQIASLTGNNYRYSRDNGNSFQVVAGGSSAVGRFINPTDYDDVNDVLLGAHNVDNLTLVTNLPTGTGTPTVNQVPLAALNGRQVSAVKFDPNSSTGDAWIAGSNSSGSPVIIRLQNAHTTTPVVTTNFTFPTTLLPAAAYISSIDVEEGNPNRVVITASNYGVTSVLQSVDAGLNWVSLDGNGSLPDIPVRWVVIAPANAILSSPSAGAGGLIIGTELGVWTTSQVNGTATNWVPNNQQFPLTRIDMIKYRKSDYIMAAATHGRGIFTTMIPSTSTSINPVANTKGFISYISATKQQLFVKTGNINGLKSVTLNVLDVQGRMVLSRKINYAPQMVDISRLNAGVYIVKLYGENKERFTQQFVK